MRLILVVSVAALFTVSAHAQKWGGDIAPGSPVRPGPSGSGASATVDLTALRVPGASIGADLDVVVVGDRVEVSRDQLTMPDQGMLYVQLKGRRSAAPAPSDGSFGTPPGTYRVRLNIAAAQRSPKPLPAGSVTLGLDTRSGQAPSPTIVGGVGQPTVCSARAGGPQSCDVLVSTSGSGIVVKATGSQGWVAVHSVQVFREK